MIDNKVKIFITGLSLLTFFFTVKRTQSYFSDTEVSRDNVLSISLDYGAPSQSPTPSLTPEVTPTPTPEALPEIPTPTLTLTPTPETAKINICHTTGSETNPWQALNIDQSDWPSHQGHGDFLYNGPVGANGKPTTEGEDWCKNNIPTPTPTLSS